MDRCAGKKLKQRTAARSKGRLDPDQGRGRRRLSRRWPLLKRRRVEPGTLQANELAARPHRASIERFYDCGDEMHRVLAEMYLADARFTRYYDDVEPGAGAVPARHRCRKPQFLDRFGISLRPMAGSRHIRQGVRSSSPISKVRHAFREQVPRLR